MKGIPLVINSGTKRVILYVVYWKSQYLPTELFPVSTNFFSYIIQ